MCGGGGGGVSQQLAVQSANQEQARQDRINQGMRQLEVMFSGGRTGANRLGADAAYDPTATYYDQSGSVWRPQSLTQYAQANPALAQRTLENGGLREISSNFTDAGPTSSLAENPDWVPAQDPQLTAQTQQQQFQDMLKGGGLYSGVSTSGGFQPEFFDKAYNAQLGYALPEVDKQFQKAQRDLTYALARQGLSASSQGAQLGSDLEGQRQRAIQGEQDKANQVRAQQQQSVENERAELTRLLQSTGDVESTMNMAASRRSMLDAAPSLATVGPLFQNATGTLADMIVNPALRSASTTKASGGYGSGANSGKVVT